nr:hypothetical protein CFP56_67249 [Quercus suber]
MVPNLEELKLEQGFDKPSDKLNGFSSMLAQGLCNLKTLYVELSFIEEICAHQLVDKEGQHARTLKHLTVREFVCSVLLIKTCNEGKRRRESFQLSCESYSRHA